MHFNPPLEPATLIKRYKRFLADITLPDDRRTIRIANTGAMTGCATPGNTVWYSTSDNAKRKYPNSWEISETDKGHRICVNTAQEKKKHRQLAVEAIENKTIVELLGYDALRTEVKYGSENSRIDILLEDSEKPPCYIEVKCHCLMNKKRQSKDKAFFPDSVTTRGQKHTCVNSQKWQNLEVEPYFYSLFYIQVLKKVSAAHHIDAKYSLLLKQAQDAGVEVLCYKAELSSTQIQLKQAVEFINS